MKTDVTIIGAGPVGLTLALDLASRGVRVVVIEMRAEGEPPSVKCNHVSARSMEIFRRLGLAAEIRDAGLPADYPQDVSYRTTTTGAELTRIRIPSRAERFTENDDGPDSTWPTAEPPHRINQIYLEPILARHAAREENIEIRYRTEATGFEQDDERVLIRAVGLADRRQLEIEARFLIGCDGGRSPTRKAIGARLEGDAVIQRVQSTDIVADDLIDRMKVAPAWAMFSLNPRRSGNVYTIDGRSRWLVHNYLRDEEADFESVDRDRAIRDILGVGEDFDYEILNKEDWFGRRLVADKVREGRVFVCGDAAHLWVPYAGYGMNAGIADAANLAWLLAAHINRWAPYEILDAHQAERLPITEQVSHFAMNHCHAMAQQRGAVPGDIEDATPDGEAARRSLGERAYALNVQQYCCGGLNFGYYYDRSPIIAYDGETQPAYSMADFKPSIVPGCRVPHLWLADGRSLYDAMGPDYALLRFDPAVDVSQFMDAAHAVSMPLRIVDVVSDDPAAAAYTARLVLARPDQHVAWRGDELPGNAGALVDLVRGARQQSKRAS